MKIIKTLTVALLIAAISVGASACLNPVSIDSSGYVVAVGVDLGKTKPYEITLQLQRASAGNESANSGGSIILSVEASDLFSAAEELSCGITYTLNFSRTHVFIFGKQMAESGSIGRFLDFPFDLLRIRQSALMIVVDSSVRDYIGGLSSGDTPNIAKLQDDIVSDVCQTGSVSAINTALFFEAVESGLFDPVMPVGYYDDDIVTDTKQKDLSGKGENPVGDSGGGRLGGIKSLTAGSALFSGETMTAMLDPYETGFMNMASGDFRQGRIGYATDKGEASVFIKLLHSKRTVIGVSKGTAARIDITLTASVESDPSGIIGKNWLNGEKEKLESFISERINAVFYKCRSAGCDAFRLGCSAVKNVKSVGDYEAFDWKGIYSGLVVEVNITVTLDDEYSVLSIGGNK